MRIALDAMGGDNAPAVTVDGAIDVVNETENIDIQLVGSTEKIREILDHRKYDTARIGVVHASEVVDMEEKTAIALRHKKDSSIRVAVKLVKEGECDAVVSAGHSGVAMATSLTLLKKAPGVDRPAIAVQMPNLKGRFVLIDGGANVDCKPVNLLQFALMGNAYYKTLFNVQDPKVALISIGEEDSKGNELTIEAFKLLKDANINFTGNIEGKDVFKGSADVIVCDGFIGNTVLKLSEGLAEAVLKMLKQEITNSLVGKLGYLLMKPALRNFKKRTDYDEYGGAPLLGINGICVICHGRSSAKAIKNALKVTAHLHTMNLSNIVAESINSNLTRMKEHGLV